MGRPESAVVAGTKQSEELARWLRSQREHRALTYVAMAELTGQRFSPATLSRGASGRRVSREVVLAYAEACGADTNTALRLWKDARRAEAHERRRARASADSGDLAKSVRRVVQQQVRTHPKVIGDFAKLLDAMVELRAREGQPSLREMQDAAGKTPDGRHRRLPKSSLSVILRGGQPPSRAHLTAFLEALGVPDARVRLWETAWDRSIENEARKAPAVVPLKLVVFPPAAQPAGPPAPEAGDAGGLDIAEERVLFDTMGTVRMPGPWHRPQPEGPVALTPSGLPIRKPRRTLTLPHASTSVPRRYKLRFIAQEEPDPPLTVQDSPAPEGPLLPPVLPPPADPPHVPFMSRMVERFVARRPRHARTRWPNY